MCVWIPVMRSSTALSFIGHPKIGFLDNRRCDHFCGLPVSDECAIVKNDDAVSQRTDYIHLVLHQKNNLISIGLYGMNQIKDYRYFIDTHSGSRLVKHEYFRLGREQYSYL